MHILKLIELHTLNVQSTWNIKLYLNKAILKRKHIPISEETIPSSKSFKKKKNIVFFFSLYGILNNLLSSNLTFTPKQGSPKHCTGHVKLNYEFVIVIPSLLWSTQILLPSDWGCVLCGTQVNRHTTFLGLCFYIYAFGTLAFAPASSPVCCEDQIRS